MTAWIFGGNDCQCAAPSKDFSAVKPYRESSDSEPRLPAETTPEPTGHFMPELGARFEILGLLGEGGMGAVYKVRERETQKVFAAKVLKPELARDPGAVRRFEQEVLAASELTHPNLIFIYGSHRTADGAPYMVMTFVDGESLSQCLQYNKTLPAARALHIFRQVAEALQHVHEKGIVHRDLKPSNILIYQHVTKKDAVRLVDFGIAKMQGLSGTGTLTQTGELFGSPYYMSPEQCSGEALDARSDIYSLGCVMYQTLCGKPPFESDNAIKTMFSHLQDKPKPLHLVKPGAEIPKSLEAVVMRCLAKDPAARYPTAAALASDLEAVAAGRVITKSSESFLRKLSQTHGKSVVLLSLGFLLGSACTYAYLHFEPSSLKKMLVSITAPKQALEPKSSQFAQHEQSSLIPDIADITSAQIALNKMRPGSELVDLISGAIPVSDDDLKPMARVKTVRQIWLNCELLTARGIGYIPNDSLEALCLKSANFDFTCLQRLTNIRSIQLDRCTLSAHSFSAIAKLPNLLALRIVGTAIDDDCLNALAGTKLTTLEISACEKITDAGWKSLAKIASLKTLLLSRPLGECQPDFIRKCLPHVEVIVRQAGPNRAKTNVHQSYEMARKAMDEGAIENARAALQTVVDNDAGQLHKIAALFLKTRLPKQPVPPAAEQLNIAASQSLGRSGKLAESLWQESIRKYPNFEWPYCNLAGCYRNENRDPEAEQLLKHALALNPNYFDAYFKLVELSLDHGDMTAAKRYLQQMIALDPTNLVKSEGLEALKARVGAH